MDGTTGVFVLIVKNSRENLRSGFAQYAEKYYVYTAREFTQIINHSRN